MISRGRIALKLVSYDVKLVKILSIKVLEVLVIRVGLVIRGNIDDAKLRSKNSDVGWWESTLIKSKL